MPKLFARVAELVDALDLGSSRVIPVRVRVSPLVPVLLQAHNHGSSLQISHMGKICQVLVYI